MTKVDENIQTAQNILSWIVERCYELEEENEKLKLQIAELMWERDWKQMKIDRLEERIKEHVPTQILADFRNRFKD